jgi:thymidylate synthase (FAD)
LTKILDKGELTLVDSMGSDLSVVRAARISNGAALPEWRGVADEKLIRFLAEHGHMSPFEHATFQFYVKCPIFVAREWQRHRTFSYNERSGRYKEFDTEFYEPATWRAPDPRNKQSSVDADELQWASKQYHEACQRAFMDYNGMIKMGVAREMARMVLPVSTYTEFIVTGNFRNWMHFLELRNSEEAQYEIRVYADAIASVLKEKMPISYSALVNDAT